MAYTYTNATTDKSVEGYGKALLADIEAQLRHAPTFTREDLMQLGTFDWVATITRYHYVRLAVTWLVVNKKLEAGGWNELRLPTKRKRWFTARDMQEEFESTVRALVRELLEMRAGFMLSDVLRAWTTDPHVTTDTKRVIIRSVLRLLTKQKALRKTGPGVWYGSAEDVTEEEAGTGRRAGAGGAGLHREDGSAPDHRGRSVPGGVLGEPAVH